MSLKLKSGFEFDYDNLYGEGKVTDADLKSYEADLKRAHEAMKVMREKGFIRAHLSKDGEPEKVLFSQLPYVEEGHLNSPSSMKHLQELTDHVKDNVDVVVSLGIGGSYLGDKVIFDVQCGEFWNSMTKEERGGFPKVYFSGNNIDPQRTYDLIHYLEKAAEVKKCHEGGKLKVLLLVISKSGGTLDTMSNFMVIYDELGKCADIDQEVVAVTDPNMENQTLLKKLAIEKGWPQYAVPDGVGGRFSIFSEVGLTLAACVGFDIKAFLNGAKDMDQACQNEDIWQNPAMLNAALKFAASEKHGRDIEVMMPYGDYMESISMWYIQLLAESLGKQYNREGKEVCYGRTPIVAVGTRDMHSMTQQHQEGRLNKVIQFLKVKNWKHDYKIPNVFPEAKKLADIAGVTMSDALETARQSNADALTGNHRYNATFTLPELNAYHLGELLYMLAMSIAYEGELADVDAFNQPGVEAYKKIMWPRLNELKKEMDR